MVSAVAEGVLMHGLDVVVLGRKTKGTRESQRAKLDVKVADSYVYSLI